MYFFWMEWFFCIFIFFIGNSKMVEYEKLIDWIYKKIEEMKLKFGVWVSGGKSYSMVEVCGYEWKGWGLIVGIEV